MAYTVRVKAKAKKSIRAIPQPKLRQRVRDAIDGLEKNLGPKARKNSKGRLKTSFCGASGVVISELSTRYATKNSSYL